MKRITFFLVLALLPFLLTGAVSAMESDGYRLDWFTPLTGSGGAASSANYAINFTVGQSAVGASSSASYESCLGYWCGGAAEHKVYLPLVVRN